MATPVLVTFSGCGADRYKLIIHKNGSEIEVRDPATSPEIVDCEGDCSLYVFIVYAFFETDCVGYGVKDIRVGTDCPTTCAVNVDTSIEEQPGP